MTSSAHWHPEHDRTSCSDSQVINADPAGSTGCARCTALLLDQRVAALAALRAIEKRALTGKPFQLRGDVIRLARLVLDQVDASTPE